MLTSPRPHPQPFDSSGLPLCTGLGAESRIEGCLGARGEHPQSLWRLRHSVEPTSRLVLFIADVLFMRLCLFIHESRGIIMVSIVTGQDEEEWALTLIWADGRLQCRLISDWETLFVSVPWWLFTDLLSQDVTLGQ